MPRPWNCTRSLRTPRVALFLDHIPKGSWGDSVRTGRGGPGSYHAMPTQVHAMYAPHLKCNGEEIRLTVKDRSVSEGTK